VELGKRDSVVCSKKTCKNLFCTLQSTSREWRARRRVKKKNGEEEEGEAREAWERKKMKRDHVVNCKIERKSVM